MIWHKKTLLLIQSGHVKGERQRADLRIKGESQRKQTKIFVRVMCCLSGHAFPVLCPSGLLSQSGAACQLTTDDHVLTLITCNQIMWWTDFPPNYSPQIKHFTVSTIKEQIWTKMCQELKCVVFEDILRQKRENFWDVCHSLIMICFVNTSDWLQSNQVIWYVDDYIVVCILICN